MNRVIIIGGDHHNTLAVIRSFGKKKIPMVVLIHGVDDVKKINLAHSKYIKDIYCVQENNIYKWLKEFKNSNDDVLFPCSDLAEYVIDKNYSELSKKFLLPGFRNNAGHVITFMNKYYQKKWAQKHKIPMAKTWEISKKQNTFIIPKNIIYPCIIKPEISAFGKKSDIKVANNMKELQDAFDFFIKCNYSNVVVQEFLQKKYEVCAFGCILSNSPIYCGGVMKKIREYPLQGGSTTFSQFINDEVINSFLKKIIFLLHDEGYTGMYDIELLICNNGIYLNEINFRHSGNGYALIKNGVDAPYIWYSNITGLSDKFDSHLIRPNGYFMDELNELSLYRSGNISLKTFFNDVKKSFCYAKLDKKDFFGGFYYFVNRFRRKLKKKKV